MISAGSIQDCVYYFMSVVFILVCSTAVVFPAQSNSKGTTQNPENSKIPLITTKLKQEFCRVGNEQTQFSIKYWIEMKLKGPCNILSIH